MEICDKTDRCWYIALGSFWLTKIQGVIRRVYERRVRFALSAPPPQRKSKRPTSMRNSALLLGVCTLPHKPRTFCTGARRSLPRLSWQRPTRRATAEVRAGHQSQDRQGPRSGDPPVHPFPGGRSDPLSRETSRSRSALAAACLSTSIAPIIANGMTQGMSPERQRTLSTQEVFCE
jgi:hypothetical protein